MKKMKEILADENGQGTVEYGLILGLLAVAAVAVIVILGPQIKNIYQGVSGVLPTPPAAS